MSDRDSETGQFASAEPLTGQAGVEADYGSGIEGLPTYTPMKEDPPEERPNSSIEEEAQRLAASRIADDPVVEVGYLNTATGEQIDPNETVSLERVAKDLSEYHGAQDEERARTVSADFANEIDRQRAEALKETPEIAKELGLSKEEIAAAKAVETEVNPAAMPAEQVSSDDPYADIEGLEPETREALKKPQVRQFLELNAAETDQAVQTYKAGLNQAHAFGQGAMLAVAPELAQIPVERWAEAVNILSQTNPARSQQLQQTFANVAALNERQQLVDHYQATQHRQQLDAYRATQNAIIEKAVPLTYAAKAEFADDLINYVADFGVSRANLVQAMENNPLMHHAAFQKMAYEAIQYNKLLKAEKPRATRDLPPVSRPGTSVHRSSSDSSSIAALQRQLETASGHKAARIAAKIQGLKRAANG